MNAPEAWANVAADGAPGGSGVIVAVLDTGVAYANHGPFRRSPDFAATQFVKGYDFVDHDPYPNDRNGHGTFVAGEIAEETNNRLRRSPGSPTAPSIMPVRVLDTQGEGEASTIAEGVRFAVNHGAQVINLSLEFSPDVTAADIPELIEALRYAHRHGVLVVAAAGNEGHAAIAYPARAPDVVSVGRDDRTRLPGRLLERRRRADARRARAAAPTPTSRATPTATPNASGQGHLPGDVHRQLAHAVRPASGYEGTSMATPHVAATAALIIASGVLGTHPTPAQLTARLRATARKLGGGGDESLLYGAGLVDAAAATAPGGPAR